MKYWLLTTEYPPFYGGGIGTYCYHTAAMMQALGCEVTVIISDDTVKGDRKEQFSDGIRIVRFHTDRNDLSDVLGHTARLSYAFAGIVKTLILEDGSPDVIESQDYLGIAYYLTQYKHLGYSFVKDVPILITLHSPAFIYLDYNRVPVYRFPDFWTCEMEKQAIRAADLLISPSLFLVREIQQYMDISNVPVEVLPNPYATGLPVIQKPSYIPGKIIYYGKLSPQKGSFQLLEYFAALWDEGFPHTLQIVGGTDIVFHPEQRTMGQLLQTKYKDYETRGLLQFAGSISPDWIKDTLQYAHLVIVPSIVDNMPYVVLEAMSLGKVVLASIQGGQSEIIEEGRTGFLFDHNDPPSFARQLTRILSLPPEEIQQIGANASKQIHTAYSYPAIGPQKLRLLQEMIKNPAPARQFPFLHQEPHPPQPAFTGQSPLLSIVIPYHNMGAYIKECLASLFNTTYPHKEIIIIDDGSTDSHSIRVLEELAHDRRLTIIKQKNQGLASTRNYGAQLAKGAYLAFLDADDKVATTYYEKAIHILEQKDNIFFVGAWTQYFGDSRQLWPTFTPQPPYALVHNPLNSSSLVYKRAAFLTGGLNDKRVDYGLEDYDSVISMMRHGFNGVTIPEPLFFYRVRKDSMFRKATREKLLYSNRYIADKHREYFTRFATQVIHLLNANGPGYQFDNPTFGVHSTTVTEKDAKLTRHLKTVVKKSPRLKKLALSIKHKLHL
ncbi:MAG TPA: glycosyltransferase [Puia sp.]|nr:glycosyltransferase [Puia sp.]